MRKIAIGVFALVALGVAGVAQAGIVCRIGYVMGQAQQVCWFEETPGGGGGGGGSPGGPGGGGGGGGGLNPEGVWVDLNIDGRVVKVNVLQKKVIDMNINCQMEWEIHQRSAGAILIRFPQLQASSAVRLTHADGEWMFYRASGSGSLQMVPVPGETCRG